MRKQIKIHLGRRAAEGDDGTRDVFYRRGSFAVTAKPDAPLWTVTHVPTGKSALHPRTLAGAKWAVRALAAMPALAPLDALPFGGEIGELNPRQRAEVSAALRTAMDALELYEMPRKARAVIEAQRAARPRVLIEGTYTATVTKEGLDAGELCTRWTVSRAGVEVGALFAGRSYPGRVHGSLNALVGAGPLPEGASDPRSPHYGIAFDVSPRDTPAQALQELVYRAERLIAWRAES